MRNTFGNQPAGVPFGYSGFTVQQFPGVPVQQYSGVPRTQGGHTTAVTGAVGGDQLAYGTGARGLQRTHGAHYSSPAVHSRSVGTAPTVSYGNPVSVPLPSAYAAGVPQSTGYISSTAPAFSSPQGSAGFSQQRTPIYQQPSGASTQGQLAPPPASPWRFNPQNPKVFLDIAIGGQPCGRFIIELFADAVPRTANNFRSLCTGERGVSPTGSRLHFAGSRFHRIIKNFVCQGGDTTVGDGTGGESIYGVTFEDESFQGKAGKHWGLGTMSMANAGPNTNGSQFSMCVDGVYHLDGVHVVFGQVLAGLALLKTMNGVPTDANDTPQIPVVITNCGVA